MLHKMSKPENLELDLAVTIPTLLGSILSMLAASAIFICYLVLPVKRHFRHTFILNLAAADFINGLNNTASGIYILRWKRLADGPLCSFNGIVGVVTVQGTDFTILFISIATVMTLQRTVAPYFGFELKLLLTFAIWFVPFVNGFIGLWNHAYQPVSGNWCWIGADHPTLRYTIGHGWRIAIFLATIGVYIYLYRYIHQVFEDLRADTTPVSLDSSCEDSIANIYVVNEVEITEEVNEDHHWRNDDIPFQEGLSFPEPSKNREDSFSEGQPSSANPASPEPPTAPLDFLKTAMDASEELSRPSTPASRAGTPAPSIAPRDPLALTLRPITANQTTTTVVAKHTYAQLNNTERYIKKLVLLNAYPIGYLVLLAPGIANRFVESSGRELRGFQIAQASTQFVGLANFFVYAYNERIWARLALWYRTRFGSNKSASLLDSGQG